VFQEIHYGFVFVSNHYVYLKLMYERVDTSQYLTLIVRDMWYRLNINV